MQTDGLVDVKELEALHRTNIMTAYSRGMSVIELTDFIDYELLKLQA